MKTSSAKLRHSKSEVTFSGGFMKTLFATIEVLMPAAVILFIGALIHDWRQMAKFNRVYDFAVTKKLTKRDIISMIWISLFSSPSTAFIAFATSRPDSPWHIPYLPFVIMSVSFGIIFLFMLIHLHCIKRYAIKLRGDK